MTDLRDAAKARATTTDAGRPARSSGARSYSAAMTWRYTRVDAFTRRPFAGNPAAVIVLPAWPDDALLATVAAELNLSETAYVVDRGRADCALDLRWFTPTVEVDLCGHATLAAGVVVLAGRAGADAVRFTTRSGVLTVARAGADTDGFTLDLPARPPTPVDDPALVRRTEAALGAPVRGLHRADKLLAEVADGDVVRAVRPDLALLATLCDDGVIVTAGTAAGATVPGIPPGVDFVSRFFTPNHGIDEDPVTGSAHCVLAPFWAARLGRTTLHAHQVSARGGELGCALRGDRVALTGAAVVVGHGQLVF